MTKAIKRTIITVLLLCIALAFACFTACDFTQSPENPTNPSQNEQTENTDKNNGTNDSQNGETSNDSSGNQSGDSQSGSEQSPKHTCSFVIEKAEEKYLKSAATCTEKAVCYKSCSCGEKGTTTFEYGTALGHRYTNYVSDNNATCEKDGTETATCDHGCGTSDTRTKENSALGHDYGAWESNGNDTHTKTCSHDSTHTVTESCNGGAATCTNKAICSDCGEEYGTVLPHNYASEWTKTKTHHYHECSCGAKADEAEHMPSAEPTETTAQTCTVCGYVIQPELGHVHTLHLTKVDAKEASCTEAGNIEYYTCSCEKWFSDSTALTEITDKSSVIISKEAHSYTQLKHNATEHWYECVCGAKNGEEAHKGGTATCTEQAICEDCNAKYGTTLGHNYSEWVSNSDGTHTKTCSHDDTHTVTENCHGGSATCTEQAICEDCNANYGDALGHSYTNYVSDDNATCESNGTETATCDRGCGTTDTKTVESSALGHNYGAPTYVWNGDKCIATRICLNDNNHKESETATAIYVKDTEATEDSQETGHYEVTFENSAFAAQKTLENSVTVCEALGHSYTNYVYNNDAKCEINGTETATCDRLACNSTHTREKADSALEHDWQKTEKVIYCTLSGEYQLYECSLCLSGKQVLINKTVISHALPDTHNHLSVGDICEYCGGEVLAKNGDSLVIRLGDTYQVEHYSGTAVCFSDYASLINSAYILNEVISIGSGAFKNYTALTSVTIPNSVTSIGSGAFNGCSSLESMTIPFVGSRSGVTSTDTYQFPFGYIFGANSYTGGTATEQYYYGSSTSSATKTTYYIPNSLKKVTVTGGNILYGAFYNCSSLRSVTIGNSVTSIEWYAFNGCYRLDEVINKSNLTIIKGSSDNGYIGYYALNVKTEGTSDIVNKDGYLFYMYDNVNYLLEYVGNETSLTLPENYNGQNYKIHRYAFYNCSSLTSITIPDSVTSIGTSAFYGCSSLTSITIPDNVTSIGGSAFYYCSSLVSVTIPDSVKSIGYRAFSYCKSLKSVAIPNSVKSIGGSAFLNCSSLTSVTIGNSVTSIGESAFERCSSLRKVNYTGTIDQWGQIDFGNSYSNPTYYAGNLYVNNVLVTEANITTATKINDYAFLNCSSLTSVTIGNSVTSIGESAFEWCSSLTNVYYGGTAEQWSNISVGSYNSKLTAAARYYYSETEPTESGSYWHYDENGDITIW